MTLHSWDLSPDGGDPCTQAITQRSIYSFDTCHERNTQQTWSRLGNFRKIYLRKHDLHVWRMTQNTKELFQSRTQAPCLPTYNSFLTGRQWGWSILLHLQNLSSFIANTQELPGARNCLFDILVLSLQCDALFWELSRMRYFIFNIPECSSSVYGWELLYLLSYLQKG